MLDFVAGASRIRAGLAQVHLVGTAAVPTVLLGIALALLVVFARSIWLLRRWVYGSQPGSRS